MGQAAAITINDGVATPVAHTFNPESITPAVSSFADRTSGVSVLFPRLGVSNSFAQAQGSVNKSKFTVELPVGATVNGVLTVVRTLRAKVEYILPDGCTDAERKDLHAYVTNGLAHAAIRGSMRDLDPQY